MNDHEKTRIAAAINQLRPDWPAASLRSLLDRPAISNRPRRDVAVALAWIACETTTQTPARVLESGPWWKAAGIEGQAQHREPYDPAEFCDICGKPHGRHPAGDHEFVSALDHTRRLADARRDPERQNAAALKQLVACEEPHPPPSERAHKPSENVDRLRHLAETGASGEDA